MLSEEHWSMDGKETLNIQNEDSTSSQDFPPVCESRGNSILCDLISNQPVAHAVDSHDAAECEKLQPDLHHSTCPQYGLPVPKPTGPPSMSLNQLQGHSSGERSRTTTAGSNQPAATQAGWCFHLLLACLSCQCSVLLLGLLESCFSGLHTVCSCCCHACAGCCSTVQEEITCHTHCHSVLFESCCEPTECLQLCVECCHFCHHG
ncbi:uncharacterized protein LOC114466192 [Gouania willdenowi]|uniref:uncharacterized protein LOC114466192 n=1 Tax=Gouania willdenowi TaxID=441366 RepID=UPI001055F846|nr:uncharacterized protein LOC114466192 [Gouania willdenowi]